MGSFDVPIAEAVRCIRYLDCKPNRMPCWLQPLSVQGRWILGSGLLFLTENASATDAASHVAVEYFAMQVFAGLRAYACTNALSLKPLPTKWRWGTNVQAVGLSCRNWAASQGICMTKTHFSTKSRRVESVKRFSNATWRSEAGVSNSQVSEYPVHDMWTMYSSFQCKDTWAPSVA